MPIAELAIVAVSEAVFGGVRHRVSPSPGP